MKKAARMVSFRLKEEVVNKIKSESDRLELSQSEYISNLVAGSFSGDSEKVVEMNYPKLSVPENLVERRSQVVKSIGVETVRVPDEILSKAVDAVADDLGQVAKDAYDMVEALTRPGVPTLPAHLNKYRAPIVNGQVGESEITKAYREFGIKKALDETRPDHELDYNELNSPGRSLLKADLKGVTDVGEIEGIARRYKLID